MMVAYGTGPAATVSVSELLYSSRYVNVMVNVPAGVGD